MIKIGITGQSGFIGTHLTNQILIRKNDFNLVPFNDDYFSDISELANFVKQCDCIVHLAALNRHNDPDKIYSENISLVEKLINALQKTQSKAHIIFSSSTQEERSNTYGKSKKIGREKLAEWAKKNRSGFTGLIIPNVFGPFGRPFYNSVISTFSYQLTNNQQPKIEIDAELKLIYIDELIKIILEKINNNFGEIEEAVYVQNSYSLSVSGILERLELFKGLYLEHGIIPNLESTFDINLFNTFRSYIYFEKQFPFYYKVNTDERGIFVELMKLGSGGQVSYSVTKPGITRGNHFHTRKIERFAVVKGKALIQLRRIGTNNVLNFELDGKSPSFVDMPVWYTHNITNIGSEELLTVFWINEFYDQSDPDTYFESVM